ncbi:MAG: enoyl-CoA hydratase [Myxococcales bacterium]|nr:enoyl-CoA hydratase [Myxococcales bacterium]
MSESKVLYERVGRVAILSLCDPPANTYSYAMMRDLDDAILKARFDDEVAVIVVTGSGEKFFCAGADINMLQDVTPEFKYNFCLHANETLVRLEQTPKLVIGALNGHTVGGGLEVALACDIRVAKEDGGKIGVPEVKLGVLPGTGGTQRLLRLLGKGKALQLMASGRSMGVAEARELGLVDEVFEADGFMEKVMAYAEQFTPPHAASKAIGLIKRAVQTGDDVGLSQGLALERELQQQLFTSADAKEGMSAFSEKRKAEYTGR